MHISVDASLRLQEFCLLLARRGIKTFQSQIVEVLIQHARLEDVERMLRPLLQSGMPPERSAQEPAAGGSSSAAQ